MQKKLFIPAVLSVYELSRLLWLVNIKPVQDLSALPPSWYAALPLLILPFVFTLFFYGDNEASPVLQKLYALTKFMSVISLTVWLWNDITPRLRFFTLNRLPLYLAVLIFLLIDGILAVLYAVETKRKDHEEE